MAPFGYRSLFRSRWRALLWAAGICWTAVEVAGWSGGTATSSKAEASTDGNSAAASNSDADLSDLENKVQVFEAGR